VVDNKNKTYIKQLLAYGISQTHIILTIRVF